MGLSEFLEEFLILLNKRLNKDLTTLELLNVIGDSDCKIIDKCYFKYHMTPVECFKTMLNEKSELFKLIVEKRCFDSIKSGVAIRKLKSKLR